MKHKGIVFGGGFLGKRIAKELRYLSIPRQLVNCSNQEAVDYFISRFKPQIVINAVGKTSGQGAIGIDYCRLHPEESYNSNVVAAENIARASKEYGAYFVHLGSGCVYQGDNEGKGWSEEHLPNFSGQTYSEHKQEAERRMREGRLGGLIIRLRMPIDDRSDPRNLITKGIANLQAKRGVIKIPNSMTTVPHMIKAIGYMIANRVEGIYNFTNPGTICLYDIMEMARDMRIHNFPLKEMTEEELRSVVIDPRSNCVLNSQKLQNLLPKDLKLPEIHEGVRQCLENYKRN